MTSCIHLEKEGLVNWDWFFGEIMETSSVCEKDTERKDRQNISSKTMCTHKIDKREVTVVHDVYNRGCEKLLFPQSTLILNVRCLLEENPPLKNCGITLERGIN